jgi:hypothetical protein
MQPWDFTQVGVVLVSTVFTKRWSGGQGRNRTADASLFRAVRSTHDTEAKAHGCGHKSEMDNVTAS